MRLLSKLKPPPPAAGCVKALLTADADALAAYADQPESGWLLTCAALQPLVGRATSFLPTKKLFFLSHWSQNLSGPPTPE